MIYLFGGLLTLVDRLGVLPAPIPSPVASCGAALSGAGLGGVLAMSAYVRIGSPPPCGSSSTGTCGASGVLSSWGVVDGAFSEERVPSPEGGTSTSNLSGCSIHGL